MKKILPLVFLATGLMSRGSDVAFSSLFQPFSDYPNIGEIQTPNEWGGFVVPFRTAGGEYQLDSVTLEHYNFGHPNFTPVEIQVYKHENTTPFFPIPVPVADAELVGSLSFSGFDPRDTRWPGQTTFDTYKPDSPIDMDSSDDYFLYIFCNPDATADLLTFFPTPSHAANLPDWKFGPHFRGDDLFFLQAAEVAFEMDVTTLVEPPPTGNAAPETGSTVALLLIGLLGLESTRFILRKEKIESRVTSSDVTE